MCPKRQRLPPHLLPVKKCFRFQEALPQTAHILHLRPLTLDRT